jgi:hypothetical protein
MSRRNGRYFKTLDEAVGRRINRMIDIGKIFGVSAGLFGNWPI